MNDEEDISSEIESLRDLCGLQTRDENSRHQFLESLGRTLKSWTNRRGENVENGVHSFLSDILPCILRLSLRSPFPDIRESCSELLVAVKVWNLDEIWRVVFTTMAAHEKLVVLVLGKRNKGSTASLQGTYHFYPIKRGIYLWYSFIRELVAVSIVFNETV